MDGDPTTFLVNLCQCFVTLTIKKCFLVFRWNFMCFSLFPLPLSCPWAILRSIWLPLQPSDQLFVHLVRSPLGLLFSSLNSHRSLSFFYSHIIIFATFLWTCYSKSISFFVLGSPELDAIVQTWSHQCWAEKKDHLAQSADDVVPNAGDSVIQSWERSLQLTVVNNCAWVPLCWTSMLELLVFGKGNHAILTLSILVQLLSGWHFCMELTFHRPRFLRPSR